MTRPPLCPICRKAGPQPLHRPFCSLRCANLDLHRWLVGAYAIPMQDALAGAESAPDQDAEEEPPRAPWAEPAQGEDP
jgi:hypothetical protein